MRYSAISEALPFTVPFVAPEELERQLGRPFVLRLGANESPFGPSPLVVAAMQEALGRVQYYGDPEARDLRVIASEQFCFEPTPERCVLGSGIDDLLYLACRAFVNPGDRVATTLGSYPTFALAAKCAGAEVTTVPYRDRKPDLGGLLEAAHGARIVYLANPDNPSGWFHSGELIEDFAANLPEETVLLLDCAYQEFADAENLPIFDPLTDNVVQLGTLSKIYGLAGLRFGWAVSSQATIQAMSKLRVQFGVNSVAQAAARAAFDDQGWVLDVREQTSLGREILSKMAKERGFEPLPSWTNFVTVDCGSVERATREMERLLANGVFVRKPGAAPLNSCIRITIGTEEQLALLDQLWSRT